MEPALSVAGPGLHPILHSRGHPGMLRCVLDRGSIDLGAVADGAADELRDVPGRYEDVPRSGAAGTAQSAGIPGVRVRIQLDPAASKRRGLCFGVSGLAQDVGNEIGLAPTCVMH